MKVYCSIPFDKEIWEEFNSQMDASGKIILQGKKAYIQVMPVDKFGFISDAEPVIEFVINYFSQIAVGLLINWLYDKLKERKVKKVVINGETCDLTDKETLEKDLTNRTKQDE